MIYSPRALPEGAASLFAGADNEKAVDSFNLRTEDLLMDLSTHKEDSGRGITTVTDMEIQFNFRNCSVVFNISK